MIVAIEGIPGAGKTSTATLLAERLHTTAICETTQSHPFLDSVYRDDERHDFEVELAFLLLHASSWRNLPAESLVVTDFSPVKDVLFAIDMLSDPSDRATFHAVHQRLYAGVVQADAVVYLRARPAMCLERVRRRYGVDARREFEKDMSIERLNRMVLLYEEHLDTLGQNVLVLDLDDVLVSGEAESESKQRVAAATLGLLQAHGLGFNPLASA